MRDKGGSFGKLPELLSPAGSFDHLKAAIAAGADAVYMGGDRFSARAYAKNVAGDEMRESLHYAHFYDKKLYLTVNTLMKEREIQEELYDFLLPCYEEGLDGVIVQDLGAARFVREHFPGMEIHASTQMTITDPAGARAAARMGMTRIVPARELSFAEIAQIKRKTGLEVEVFVHGALCYCYSGQCLMSSLYGDRSGNRGRCTQPCRLPYQLYREERKGKGSHRASGAEGKRRDCRQPVSYGESYWLSPRDLCMLSLLPALWELPVDSLKIEGRMKNVEYVAGVTAAYRKYLDKLAGSLDKGKSLIPDLADFHNLEELYCRTGFTEGYGKRHNGKQMMTVTSPKNTGRKIGEVISVFKNRIRIQTDAPLAPRDLLVIFLQGGRQDEVVLTVPEEGKLKKFRNGQLELNAPMTRRIRPGMPVWRRKSERLSQSIREDILEKEMKYPVDGRISLKAGQPARLFLQCRGAEITREGSVVQVSRKRPLKKEDVLRQMNKTGNVPFMLRHFEVELARDCFLPLSEIKTLRQTGFAALKEVLSRGDSPAVCSKESSFAVSEEMLSHGERQACLREECGAQAFLQDDAEGKNALRDASEAENVSRETPEIIAAVYDREMLEICLRDVFFDALVLPWDFFSPEELSAAAKRGRNHGKKMYFSMPRVFRKVDTKLEKVCLADIWNGIYVYTINEAQSLSELAGFSGGAAAAASFYQWNSLAAEEVDRLFPFIQSRELPVELSGRETAELLSGWKERTGRENRFEIMVYGRVPVMQSAQCLKKTASCCDGKPERLWLLDRKKRKLPVTAHCGACYNLIWLDEPRSLIGEDLSGLISGISRRRFDLFGIAPGELPAIKESYLRWAAAGFVRDKEKKNPDRHWNHGVE